MNNYIIEGNLDFKTAMAEGNGVEGNGVEGNGVEGNGAQDNSAQDNGAEDNIGVCLVSHQKLTKSHIKLPCGHKFNYMPLYNEINKQKQKNQQKQPHYFDTCSLKINQIKCPYCRTVFDNILPYIQSECEEKTYGVNYPFKLCMKNVVECEWLQRNKVKCCKEAQFINAESYCKVHFLKTHTHTQTPTNTIIWTTEMNKLYKSKKLDELKTVLKLHKLKVGGTKRELIERLFEKNLHIVFN
jgi:hypothetical protein